MTLIKTHTYKLQRYRGIQSILMFHCLIIEGQRLTNRPRAMTKL